MTADERVIALVKEKMEEAKKQLVAEMREFCDWCFEVKKTLPDMSLYQEFKDSKSPMGRALKKWDKR